MSVSGKNRRKQIEVEDLVHGCTLSVDSQEEVDFVNFCNETHSLSIIGDFEYQPPSFRLSDPVTYEDMSGKQKCLFREHNYTADFRLTINPDEQPELAKEFKIPKSELSCRSVDVFIDVKGAFQSFDGGRSFSLNQKWVWQLYRKYVYKLVPKVFFRKFGVPVASFYSKKTKKARKAYQGCKSIPESFGLKADGRQ